eukprot:7838160-Pyramimonas_sp.AAC.1
MAFAWAAKNEYEEEAAGAQDQRHSQVRLQVVDGRRRCPRTAGGPQALALGRGVRRGHGAGLGPGRGQRGKAGRRKEVRRRAADRGPPHELQHEGGQAPGAEVHQGPVPARPPRAQRITA